MFQDRILFLDGEALVIDKPAGLAVHPGKRGGPSLEDHLYQLCFGFARPPSPVHRLDRDTSGCLLLARNPKAHRRFQQAFEERKVEKVYLAVLEGVDLEPEGMIDLPLDKISSREEGWRMVPCASGSPAVTRWQVLAERNGRSLVRMAPETGRTHQLRAHAAYGLKAPVAGDPVYGRGGGPLLLHARSLRLDREGKRPVEAVAPLPVSFQQAGFTDADI
jgi:tRNA pseudouridine32 synthase / 23S rRNA pseudouridine746 synthase